MWMISGRCCRLTRAHIHISTTPPMSHWLRPLRPKKWPQRDTSQVQQSRKEGCKQGAKSAAFWCISTERAWKERVRCRMFPMRGNTSRCGAFAKVHRSREEEATWRDTQDQVKQTRACGKEMKDRKCKARRGRKNKDYKVKVFFLSIPSGNWCSCNIRTHFREMLLFQQQF